VEFPHEEEYAVHRFELQPVKGLQKVVFVFLPGCDFDFSWFQFA
jgi:beta-galactosidase